MPAHHSRTHQQGLKIQLCSVVLLLAFVATLAAPVLLTLGLLVDGVYIRWFGLSALLAVALMVAFYILAWTIRCKVCCNQLFAPRKCIRHASVSTFFGSYALWMALTSVLGGFFRCQFCGEKARVRARIRRKTGDAAGGSANTRIRHAVNIRDHDW